MTWNTGTADGYLELLQALIDLATNSHVDSVAVNAGGTGYAVGDVLAINGGTAVGGHTAAVEVLTLSGSAVATVRIARGGAYTANPGTGATTTAETGVGTGCTINTTIASTGWTVDRRTQEAVSAAVGAGGTGYSVSDQLTVVGGVQGGSGVAAVFNVDSVSSGFVTGVSLVTAGNYEEEPGNDVSVTGGGGTGCELTVTWQDATTQDQVVVMHGSPTGGFVNPYVAIQTYQAVDQFLGSEPVRNWAVFGLPAYNPAAALHEQPGISPGHDTGAGDGTVATYCPCVALKDTDASYPISFWFAINQRRILGFFGTTDSTPVFHYPSIHLGYYVQAGTRAEFPYPMFVAGSSWRSKAQYAETTPVQSGIVECAGAAAADSVSVGTGCAYLYDTGTSRWYAMVNFDFNDNGTTQTDDADALHHHGVYPLMSPYQEEDVAPTNVFASGNILSVEWYDEVIDHNVPTTPRVQLLPTPNGGDDLYLLVPATLIGHDLTEANATGLDDVFGEIESAFWFAAYPTASVSTLDTYLVGTARYRVFAQGNRTQPNTSFVAIREE